MHYPSFAEYSNALQFDLGRALSDPLLGRGTLRMDGSGLPVAHTGNFALSFEVAVDGKTYAVRCFHKHSESRHVRYDAIADCLRSIESPNFVDVEFQPSGITTASGTYPIVRMEWAEGPTLAAFVADRRNDATALQELRSSLAALARHLREYGIAHGDIQPTNIIVQGTANLRLIDYDGMFVPRLAPLHSVELGQPNFQHPDRREPHFDARLDAFSFSLLDFALDALCRQPELWDQTGSDEDAFILRAADLVDPASSPVFSLLSRVPGLEQRVKQLAAVCASPFNRIPSFEDFLAGRNIPSVSVVFSGDPTTPLRRKHDRIRDVVDATNFARCCTRVGDRVELIGPVVRVATGRGPQLDSRCLRVEFAERSRDMVCLEIWPNALAGLDEIPDETWVGNWVSAVGFIEPVRSAGSGPQRQKDIAISITESSQLHRITEAEARYRLRGLRGRTRPMLDRTAGVRTVPVATDTRPLPERLGPSPDSSAVSAPRRAPRVVDGRWSLAAALIASLAATRSCRRMPRAKVSRRRVRPPRPVHRPSRRPPPPFVPPGTAWPVNSSRSRTWRGRRADRDRGRNTGHWNGQQCRSCARRPAERQYRPGPARRHDHTGTSRSVLGPRSGRGIHAMQWHGSARGPRQPFWIELRAGLPPNVRRVPGLWASSGAGSVTAAGSDVHVDLGVWDGERRNATLTAAGNLLVSRTREPSRPLNRVDCATVARSVEACASSRDCSSFASSARRISPSQWARLTRLYHESTGLDGAAFRALCVRSCQLGLTPSRGFIRTHVCGGAPSDQWLAREPAADTILASQ